MMAVAAAFVMLPAAAELPAGSEAVLSIDVMDEAAFAALQEGTVHEPEFPVIILPEAAEPLQMDKTLTSDSAPVVALAPEPDLPVTEQKAHDIVLPALPERKSQAKPVTKTVKIEPNKPQKTPPTRVSENANSAAGRQGSGRDAISTARANPGKASAAQGMAGGAAEVNQRALIIAHLARHKRYPPSAMGLRLEGSVGISFSVGRDGVLKNASVSASSGSELLDRDALAMLRRAQPFPVSAPEGRDITIKTQIGYIYPR